MKPSERKKTFTLHSGKRSITFKPGMTKGMVWMVREDGEGGEFKETELFKHILKFYGENF